MSQWWLGGGSIMPKDDDKEWNFQNYKGTNLVYEMLCDTTCLDNEEKEGDNLSGNHIINPKN